MFVLRSFLVCLLLSFGARAQESGRTMAIAISPLSLPFGNGGVIFQYNVARFLTLTLPAHFTYVWPVPVALDIVSEKGSKLTTSRAPISIGGGLGARFYPSGKGMSDGFYLEPRFAVSYHQFGAQSKEFEKIEWKHTTITPRLYFGWDWFYDSGFYSNFGASIGYNYDVVGDQRVLSPDIKKYMKMASYVFDYIPNPESKSRLAWDIEFRIGYAW